MIQLTEEEKNDFSQYREYEHICMRHATELYEAVENLRESIQAALEEPPPPTSIRLRDLDTQPMHETMNAIRLDLYNKGLVDKP